MELDWTPRPLKEWRAMLKAAPRANLLQSWPYARAVRRRNQLMTRTAVMRRGRETVGLFQTQEVSLGPVHVVHMHRGPLWMSETPGMDDWQEFLHGFSCAYPYKLGRWRRMMPSLPHSDETRDLLGAFGFVPRGAPYETIWLDLDLEPETLRARLKQPWRHALARAEQAGLRIDIDRRARFGDWFVRRYAADRRRRRTRGPSPSFLRTLIQEAAPFGEAWILRALEDTTPIASILVILHGAGATYQAGWATPRGRSAHAHHLLLWRAILALRDAGISDFDLGGILPDTQGGITRFKLGLNGTRCTLSGLYA